MKTKNCITLDPEIKKKAIPILQKEGFKLSTFVDLKLREVINNNKVTINA